MPALKRSLIFDFDGTIADTLAEGLAIYQKIAEEEGYRKVNADNLEAFRALDTTNLFKELGIPKRKVPLLIARALGHLKARIRELPLIEGMADALPQLRDHASCIGILTSNAVDNVEAFLEVHGLRHLFDFIITTGKLSGKARQLTAIARTYSLRKEEMLYIGDEIRDLRAARKAGIGAIAVTWGLNSADALRQEDPLALVHTPAELLETIASQP